MSSDRPGPWLATQQPYGLEQLGAPGSLFPHLCNKWERVTISCACKMELFNVQKVLSMMPLS